MSDSLNKSIGAGVAVIVALIFAVVGVGILDSANLDPVLTVDSQAEWQNNGTLNGLEATADGNLQLLSANTSGNYTSNAFDNSSDVVRYHVYASLPEPDNSSVELVVDGTTYQLQDGVNKFDVTGGTFALNFERDSTSITSPQVDSVTAYSGDTGGLLRLVGVAAFGLLVLLVVVNELGVTARPQRGR